MLAGISVALVLVPQALAYAKIAGVDPVYGLYAAVAAPIAGALVGSSPYLQTGPVAVTSLLTYGALSSLGDPFTARFALLAGVLAILVGLMRLAIGYPDPAAERELLQKTLRGSIKVLTEMREENKCMPPGVETWGFVENLAAFLAGDTAMTSSEYYSPVPDGYRFGQHKYVVVLGTVILLDASTSRDGAVLPASLARARAAPATASSAATASSRAGTRCVPWPVLQRPAACVKHDAF